MRPQTKTKPTSCGLAKANKLWDAATNNNKVRTTLCEERRQKEEAPARETKAAEERRHKEEAAAREAKATKRGVSRGRRKSRFARQAAEREATFRKTKERRQKEEAAAREIKASLFY